MVDATGVGGKCQFKFRLGDGAECFRPAVRGGCCVFHAPKHPSAEKQSLPTDERGVETAFEEQFRQELYGLLKELEAVPNDEPIDFRGFEFPEFRLGENVTKRILFAGAIFHQDVKFSDITFGQGADFSHARFREGADFAHSTFEQKVSFYGTTFDKSLVASANFTKKVLNAPPLAVGMDEPSWARIRCPRTR